MRGDVDIFPQFTDEGSSDPSRSHFSTWSILPTLCIAAATEAWHGPKRWIWASSNASKDCKAVPYSSRFNATLACSCKARPVSVPAPCGIGVSEAFPTDATSVLATLEVLPLQNMFSLFAEPFVPREGVSRCFCVASAEWRCLLVKWSPVTKSSDGPETKSSPSFGTASCGKGGDAGASNSSILMGYRGDRGGNWGGRKAGGMIKVDSVPPLILIRFF